MFEIQDFVEARLTQKRLLQLLDFDQETGTFTWKAPTSRRVRAGDVAGCKHKRDGRIYIGIDGRLYKAHRLAWLYVHGVWPPSGIDHKDGDPSHNWMSNLRPADQAANMQNLRKPHSDNRSGFLGVQQRCNGRFSANISCRGARTYLGTFATAEAAHQAYLTAKRAIHEASTI